MFVSMQCIDEAVVLVTLVTGRLSHLMLCKMRTEDLLGASAEAEKAAVAKPGGGSGEDIMSVLLAHERRGGSGTAAVGAATKAILPQDSNSESSDDDDAFKDITVPSPG
ncbi:hypothetical protein J6590_055982 [Homalodisca vitripennis]|nr:hypothetical protein J6590_055982 [Homalodisca vitripennis]